MTGAPLTDKIAVVHPPSPMPRVWVSPHARGVPGPRQPPLTYPRPPLCLRSMDLQRLYEDATRYQESGQLEEAARTYRRIIGEVETALGPNDPEVAPVLGKLADVLVLGGNPASARPLLERRLRVLEELLGPDHPTAATARVDLASILSLLGNYAEIRVLIEPAIPVLEADALRPAALVAGLNLLGQAYAVEGESAAMRTCSERAIKIAERYLELGHPLLATAQNNLAVALLGQGEEAAARPLLEHLASTYGEATHANAQVGAFSGFNLALLLKRDGDWGRARTLLDRAVPVLRAALPAGNPVLSEALQTYVRVLEKEASARTDADDPAGARVLLERAAEVAEDAFGPDHPRTASLLMDLGEALCARMELAPAYSCFKRALEIRRERLDPGAPGVATAQKNLAWVEMQQGRYDDACVRLEEVLRIQRDTLGPGDVAVAGALNDLSTVLLQRGDHASARACVEEALRIHEAAHSGPAERARVLAALAEIQVAEGDYAAAQPTMEEALRINVRTLGADHPETARLACNLGAVLAERGRYAAALDQFETSLSVLERALGRAHPNVTTARHSLAVVHLMSGEHLLARGLLEEVLEAQRESLGPHHPDFAATLTALARVLREQGAATEARTLLEQALGIQERELGADHPGSILTLHVLGSILMADFADYEQARHYLGRAYRGAVKTYGPSHPLAAQILGSLAHSQDTPSETRELLQEAHATIVSLLGPDHVVTGMTLTQLSIALFLDGDHVGAVACAEEASVVLERALGPGHPHSAGARAASVLPRIEMGDGAGARAACESALEILESTVGPEHSEVPPLMVMGSWARQLCGDEEGAFDLVLDALRISVAHSRRVLPDLSFAEQHLLAQRQRLASHFAITYSREHPLSAEEHILIAWQKGLLLQALHQQRMLATMAGDPRHPAAETARELQDRRCALAQHHRRALDPDSSREDWQTAYDRLIREKETLERSLSRLVPRGTLEDPLDGARAIVDLLAPGEALVDFYDYGFVAWGPAAHSYAAFVLAPDQPSKRVELGEAGHLEELLESWRAAVLREEDATRELAAFARAVWEPVADALPAGTGKVWLCPDGQLARFPWPVLVAQDPDDRLLSVIDSPRDLARLRATRPLEPSQEEDPPELLLVGGVDFGPDELEGLPGTQREIQALDALARGRRLRTTLLVGAAATSDAVLGALPRARYAHLATHGVFGAEEELRDGAAARRSLSNSGTAGLVPAGKRNPLVESALLLASDGDGRAAWLTAEELVGLDLGSLSLIVLSACNTGRGRELNGQGVMGLRASFTAAGARTLLMSLWEVPDDATVMLMEEFYRGIWEKGLHPAAAVRTAQAVVRAATPSPYYWAAWVLVGEAW